VEVHPGKQAMKKFSCVQGCSDCCVYREYYPSKEFGKIGVLLLPEEKEKMERLARERQISVRILPRLAVGNGGPDKIIAYQMMGKESDGDFCPFLDENNRSPHGGLACSIYNDRPLACRAYPVIDAGKTATLDPHCQFCKQHSTRANLAGLAGELESLAKIKAMVKAEEGVHVWRYATATGEGDMMMPEGWVLES
jgi:Fe-S-cluster containining protein